MWHASLVDPADDLEDALSDAERLRAMQILSPRRRELWVRSRAQLRGLLGRYLGLPPASLEIDHGEHGKPELSGERRGHVSFSLAHSGELVLCAFTALEAVGVDLEVPSTRPDRPTLWTRAFGASESQRLAGLAPQAREREFRLLWARREATQKLSGVGLREARPDGAPRPWVVNLEPGAGIAAALALRTPPQELCCWTLS